MATTHTPGPWQVEHGRSSNPMVGTADVTVAEILDDVFPDTDQQAANARLIAAAPDLLAALQAVTAAWLTEAGHGDGILEEHGPALDAARTAVAKATGTSPTGGTTP